jgi:hypothetical protein
VGCGDFLVPFVQDTDITVPHIVGEDVNDVGKRKFFGGGGSANSRVGRVAQDGRQDERGGDGEPCDCVLFHVFLIDECFAILSAIAGLE